MTLKLTHIKREPDGREVWQVDGDDDPITAHFTGMDAKARAAQYKEWMDTRLATRKHAVARQEADDRRYGLTKKHDTKAGDE